MTNEQIKKISTKRLLNIFRQLRDTIRGRDPERNWDQEDYEEDELFEKIKNELDTREHITRRPRKNTAISGKKNET